MNSIVILGAGNVATHLFHALGKSPDYQVIQVFNHREERLEEFRELVSTTTRSSEILPADIYIMAVKDDALALVASELRPGNAVVVHTAGAIPATVLNSFKKYGVLYPLQTFSKNKPVDFKKVPICIEGNTKDALLVIERLAAALSPKVYPLSSQQRKGLHVAAVFVSNFVNLLYSQGEILCSRHDIPFEILQPLIQETAEKVTTLSPLQAQTGPAIRDDRKVMDDHLRMLDPEQKELYKLLTQAIQHLHGKEL